MATTVLAVSIPDQVLSYGGKVLFAWVTAAGAAVVSALVSKWMRNKLGSK